MHRAINGYRLLHHYFIGESGRATEPILTVIFPISLPPSTLYNPDGIKPNKKVELLQALN